MVGNSGVFGGGSAEGLQERVLAMLGTAEGLAARGQGSQRGENTCGKLLIAKVDTNSGNVLVRMETLTVRKKARSRRGQVHPREGQRSYR